jgi:hypothetical protein
MIKNRELVDGEYIITRAIWVAKCPTCDFRIIDALEDKSRREVFCSNCKIWIPYIQDTWRGPELIGGEENKHTYYYKDSLFPGDIKRKQFEHISSIRERDKLFGDRR